MTNEMALWLSIGSGVIAIAYGALSTRWILSVSYTHLTLPTIYSV